VLYLPDDNLGLNLARSKSFSDVTLDSFDSIGARSGYGVEAARGRAAAAVERVMDQFDVMTDYLSQTRMRQLREHHARLKLFAATH
jgi:hypothetical protein